MYEMNLSFYGSVSLRTWAQAPVLPATHRTSMAEWVALPLPHSGDYPRFGSILLSAIEGNIHMPAWDPKHLDASFGHEIEHQLTAEDYDGFFMLLWYGRHKGVAYCCCFL